MIKANIFFGLISLMSTLLSGCSPAPITEDGPITIFLNLREDPSNPLPDLSAILDDWADFEISIHSDPLEFSDWDLQIVPSRPILRYHSSNKAQRKWWEEVDALLPRSFGRMSSPGNSEDIFFPFAFAVWGLWLNPKVLVEQQLEIPNTLSELELTLERLKESGLQPMALPGRFESGALELIAQMDISLNGPEAHQQRISGMRKYTDDDFLNALEKLKDWQLRGFFGDKGELVSWQVGLHQILSGQVAFLFLDAKSHETFPYPSGLKMVSFPPASGLPKGTLAQTWVAQISKETKSPQSALLTVERFILDYSGSAELLVTGITQLEPHPRDYRSGSLDEGIPGWAFNNLNDQRQILWESERLLPEPLDSFPEQNRILLLKKIKDFFQFESLISAQELALFFQELGV